MLIEFYIKTSPLLIFSKGDVFMHSAGNDQYENFSVPGENRNIIS